MQTDLVYDCFYLLEFGGRQCVGKHVQTRGNDEDYPSFQIGMLHADPYTVSVPRVNVVGRLELVKDEQ